MHKTTMYMLASLSLLLATPALAQNGGGDGEGGGESADTADTTDAEGGGGEEADQELVTDEEDLEEQSAQDAISQGLPPTGAGRAWSINSSVTTRIGQGTFVTPEDNTELRCPPALEDCDASNAFDRVAMFYSVSPNYTIKKFILAGSFSVTHWLTAGNIANLGQPNEPNEVRISDVNLNVTWLGKSFPTGTSFTTTFGVGLPTSALSRAATQIVDTNANITFRQRILGKVTGIASFSGSKTFHQFTNPVYDISEIGSENAIFRANGAEDLGDGLVAIGGRNIEYTASGGVGLVLPVVGRLNAVISYSYIYLWSYAGGIPKDNAEDSLRSDFAQGGRSKTDLTVGNVRLIYPVMPKLLLSGSLRTLQSPKTSDQSSFRFPFWNFEGAAANRSSIDVGATYIF